MDLCLADWSVALALVYGLALLRGHKAHMWLPLSRILFYHNDAAVHPKPG